ncbi:MAG: hypothetical protein ACUVX9_01195 [Anaerolineae bacterium]
MKRVHPVLVAICLALAALPVGAGAQAPVALERTQACVVVLSDRRLEAGYTLVFTEHRGRGCIREPGSLCEPQTLVSAGGQGPNGALAVRAHPVSSSYSAILGRPTRLGEQYTIPAHYTTDRRTVGVTSIV